MIQAISWLAGSIGGLLVYYDASKNKIGKIPGEKGFTNASAGVWSLSSCILWFIVFPMYLLNRNQLLEKAKQRPQEPSNLRILILILYSAMLVYSVYNLSVVATRQSSAIPPTLTESREPQAVVPTHEFNMQDKAIFSNGNVPVAAFKIADIQPKEVRRQAAQTSAASLSKSPYASIGKLFKISGYAYKVEELPPSLGLSGRWSEILVQANNPNSPLGTSTIDFIFNGDVSRINSGQYLTCYGYFVGTYESQNAYGGTVEALVIVGNAIGGGD